MRASPASARLSTIVYNRSVPVDSFEFDEGSYAAAAAAGVDVLAVLAVLHGHPVHRRFIGGTGLIVTGRTSAGQVISVGLLELLGRDDVYRVAEVMMLSPDQAAAAEKRLEGEI
jgi:hypothetical protein